MIKILTRHCVAIRFGLQEIILNSGAGEGRTVLGVILFKSLTQRANRLQGVVTDLWFRFLDGRAFDLHFNALGPVFHDPSLFEGHQNGATETVARQLGRGEIEKLFGEFLAGFRWWNFNDLNFDRLKFRALQYFGIERIQIIIWLRRQHFAADENGNCVATDEFKLPEESLSFRHSRIDDRRHGQAGQKPGFEFGACVNLANRIHKPLIVGSFSEQDQGKFARFGRCQFGSVRPVQYRLGFYVQSVHSIGARDFASII